MDGLTDLNLKGVLIAAPLFIGWTIIALLSTAAILIPLLLLVTTLWRSLIAKKAKRKNCPEGGVPSGRA